MTRKIFATLFALPFAGVGVFMLWSIGVTLADSWRTEQWVPVNARVLDGGYTTNSGDSDTYRAYARYQYTFGGETFVNDRVALTSSGDNIGSFQQESGRRLSRAAASGETIVVYVDPEQPANSIIFRNIRWGMVGFKMIFVVVFGGIGMLLLIAIWLPRAPETDQSDPEYQASPWLLNKHWQSATIRSSSKKTMWNAWAFTLLWNAISAALPFIVYSEVVDDDNYLALIALLFPIVGLGLLVWALRRTMQWTRFGPTPVVLDPFPGSIGGDVGGTIDLKLPFDPATDFQLTLSNLYSYEKGSGENSNRREDVKWQDEQRAHAERGGKGTRLRFRFAVPAGLSNSDAKAKDSYFLWRLNLNARLAGTDIDRSFEIPVYATATASTALSDRDLRAATVRKEANDEQAIREVFELKVDAGDKRLSYPFGNNFLRNVGGFVIGSVFAVAGVYLFTAVSERLMGSVFSIFGGLIALVCLYIMFSSLDVRKDSSSIWSVRRWLGFPVRRKRLLIQDFAGLDKNRTFQTRAGDRHFCHYSVHAFGRNGDKILVGEGFRGEGQAEAAMRFIEREFRLAE